MTRKPESLPESLPEFLTFRSLSAADWPVIESLFGRKGACGGCWCMYWRVERGGRLWDQTKGEPARQAFRSLVESGRVSGILAFDHGQPVGWCCLGPRSDFPRLKRVRALQRERSENASPGWAVVCFFVLAPKRRLGIGTRLLKAATGFAFSAGASEVEGYPVKLPAAGVLPGPFAWTGVARMFERAGYRALPSPDPERPVFLARRPDVPAAAPV